MNNKTKIFILHHTPAAERKNTLSADIDAVSLSYSIEWVEAFLPDEIKCISASIKCSELSLSLKHQYALQQIIQNEIQYGVIFEDDVDLQSVPKIQEFLEQSINELEAKKGDILWIGDVWTGKYAIPAEKKVAGEISYFSTESYSRCTHAYIISQHGAKLVLDDFHFNRPVDHLYNEIIEKRALVSGWTEPGLIQKTAEGIWSSLIS